MIILPHLKALIITPPKTASTSLHTALCDGGDGGDDGGGVWVNGPSLGQRCVDHHLVGYAPGYKVLVTVRHPLDRLVSLYLHQARFDASEGRACEAFWCFGNRIGRGEHPDAFYQWNQCKYLEAFGRRKNPNEPFPTAGAFPPVRSHAPYALGVQLEETDVLPKAVHVERLIDELAAEGIHVPQLPRLNKAGGVRKGWEFYYGEGGQRDSLLAVIEPWARPDCERFGYEWPGRPRP